MRRWGGGLLAIGLAAGLAMPPAAADFDDPEWPCIQRKVLELSIGQMWPGPMPEGDWRRDDDIARLVAEVAPRRTALEDAEARAAAFAATLSDDERPEKLAQLFAGVLDTIQAERSQIISGIGRYARSQTALSERIEGMQSELVALRASAELDNDSIRDLEDTVAWDTRFFRDRAQSLTYVCETPVLLEQRAFAIARLLHGMI